MKNIVKKIVTHHITWLIALSVLFFLAVSSFNFITQDADFVKWLSPDETANYVLTKLYGQTGSLIIFEKYNLYVDDIMRPRSFRSDYGSIKPVSFLGIILIFGSIVKFTTFKIIPYLTPLFASIGIIYYYLLVRKLFNKNIALVSSVILTFFPVYTYYSARSMFHNVLFLVFLIIGVYYSLMMVDGFRVQKRLPRCFAFCNDKKKKGFLDSVGASLEMTRKGFFHSLVFGSRKRDKQNEDVEKENHGDKEVGLPIGNSTSSTIFFGFRIKSGMTRIGNLILRVFKNFISFPSYKNYLYLLYSALAGFFVGLAVMVRTSELMWIVPVFIILWIFNFRNIIFIDYIIIKNYFITLI
jgi:hypothetical protein